MANDAELDVIGMRLGIPASLLPAWKQTVAPTQAAPAPGAPSAPRPGDPGWSLVPPPPAAPAAPPAPPPPGPRPGDPGFNVTQLAPPPPQAPAAAHAAKAPTRMLTPEQRHAADIAAIQGTNEEFEKLGPMRGGPKGEPMLRIEGKAGWRAFDAAKGTEENIKAAVEADKNRKNLEGASFYDPPDAAAAGLAGAAKPYLISRGGRRAQGWQVHEGIPVSDEEKAAGGSAEDHGRTAAGLDYMAGQAQANYERGYLDRLENAQTKHAEQGAKRAEAFEREYTKHVGELDQLRQQIREAKVDPFGGMGGFGHFMGAIAVGLGAFGASRTGGVNQGLEALKHSISTNILKQEKAIDRLERGSKAEMNFLGALKAKYGDIEHAKDAAWIAYLEKSKVEMAKILGAPEVRDPQLQARYERMLKATDEELEHRLASWDARTKDKVVRHDVNAPAQYGGGNPLGKHAREDAKYLATEYNKSGIPESLAMLEGVDRTIDTFGDGDIPGIGPIMGKVPNWAMPDRAVAARQSWQAVKNSIGHALFGGALSPTEAENLSKQLDGAHDAPSLRRVVQDLRTTLHHKQRNIAGGASAGGKVLYDLQGGSVKPVQLDKPASPHIREAK